VKLIAAGTRLIADRQTLRDASFSTNRLTARSVFSSRATSGVPPLAGRAQRERRQSWQMR
jgi:hypothetical protein